jgi:ATP-dependent Clp protease ATP-binding subunit ClpB
VDFKNTIVIMTSNIGSQYIADVSDEKILRDRVMEALRLHFKPEFLNRVDDILIFQRLTKEQLREIVTLQMVRLQRLLEERHLHLELSDQARDFLADAGYDPVYGARPLRRAIQTYLQDKLAPMLLEGDFKEGDTIRVDADEKGLTFKTQA